MKKTVVAILMLLIVAAGAHAATEAEKRAAIDAGLAYLASAQQADGRWDAGGLDYEMSATSAALLAFLEEKDNWGANAAAYQTVVDKGLGYVLNQAQPYNIAVEPTGNPDTNGNGIGVKFYPPARGNNSRDTYVTGLALAPVAKAAAANPAAVVTTGSQAGRAIGDVVQDVVDYFAYGQADPGNTARGGWRYYADYGQSDNSTAQWPPIGMLYAQTVSGVTVPQFVKDELAHWVDYIQYLGGTPGTGIHGSSGYNTRTYLNNESKTGGLLVEMVFAGKSGVGDSFDLTDADVQAALAYLNREWKDGPSGWNGNFGQPYAMWSIYKGLEVTIGLDDMTTITNLHANPGDVDNPNHGWNWWEDYCEYLVNAQNANGSWNGYSSWPTLLATPWYINILAATEIPNGDDEPRIPAPGAIVLGSLGTVLVGYLRRRRNL